MLNPNLTKFEAIWLTTEYEQHKGLRIDGTTMDKYFVPARKLITGKEIGRPGCGCEFKVFAQITNSLYDQYRTEIEAIAKKENRGRKKQ